MIARARKAKGLTGAQFAKILGVPAPHLSSWEHRHSPPSWERIVAISRALDLDPRIVEIWARSRCEDTVDLVEAFAPQWGAFLASLDAMRDARHEERHVPRGYQAEDLPGMIAVEEDPEA